MRLGDLDALKKRICEICNSDYADDPCEPSDCFILNSIKSFPTIDAVTVVRCHECANHSDTDGKHYCKFWRMYCPDDSDFFCKAGKRKEAAHEVSEP